MVKKNVTEKLLQSYQRYYNLTSEDVAEPFFAEAVYHASDTHYFLLKSARLSQCFVHEYVYFAEAGELTPEQLQSLCDTAWERGLKGFIPENGHKSSDVVLYIIADSITADTGRAASRIKKYKSYRYAFQGWSRFRLVAIDVSGDKVFYNRQGRILEKIVRNAIKT